MPLHPDTSYADLPTPRSSVLIVDDERSIRLTLRAFLQEQGYAVETAEDATQALERLAQGAWDVIVSDIILPGLSGVELLKKIRAAAPDVQVIMMTGAPTVATAAEAVRAGARDYLAKPITKNAILRAVANALALKRLEEDKRRLLEENRRYQDNLERLVADRTQALLAANARLEKALDEVRRGQEELIKQERLNALGQMITGIVHDFNNALLPVVGLSSYLLGDPEALADPSRLRADLEAIRGAASAAADVVRRLREFYRPDDEPVSSPVRLGALVEQVIQLTEPSWKTQASAADREIRFETHFEDVPLVPANEPRLREALVNLVLNAMDAMPQGGVIRIATSREQEHVALSIGDNGCGMTDEVRRRCFDPFFTTKGRQGSGLGLAMVHGIVTRHHGTITVESTPGHGTTFIIRLPLARGSLPAPTLPPPPPAVMTTPPLTILVVDDEAWARNLITRFLDLKGHRTRTAASGEEALEILRHDLPELLITDRAIPDLSGDRIALEARRLAPDLPIIMLTGFGDIMDVRGDNPAGVDILLGKPVTPDQLHDAVRRAWELHRNASGGGR